MWIQDLGVIIRSSLIVLNRNTRLIYVKKTI
uniref:Uncharacterized protein n=1 Tax=Podoviridae sp. ct8Lf7 TaxID=2827723 RepID=A0A8S5S036_9CAUD|nr:MAG TPA: hypothetical protein [Podoviridae sp. ct8Lf7]